jgi:hypothetical protein
VTAKIRRRLRQGPLHELPDFEVLALELHSLRHFAAQTAAMRKENRISRSRISCA